MAYSLENRNILITGASSGIGEQLCIDLTKRNNRVIACGRNQSKLEQLKNKVGDKLSIATFDASSKTEVFSAFRQITKENAIDCMILNAGTCEYVDVERFDSSLFERVLQTNFLGTIYCIEAGLESLKQSSAPYLVLMGSSSVYFPFTKAEAYGSSKAALDYLAKSLRVDLEKFLIPVSIIHPGFVKTPLTDKNDFKMPMVIETDAASSYIIRGLEKQRLEIHFPRRFTWLLKLLRSLPESLKFSISKKLVNS